MQALKKGLVYVELDGAYQQDAFIVWRAAAATTTSADSKSDVAVGMGSK